MFMYPNFTAGSPSAKMQAILCDIDGTIAMRGDRDPHDLALVVEDAPRPNMAQVLDALAYFFHIIYISGRQEQCRPATKYWLKTHGFPMGYDLLMRRDKDNRADVIVKAEMVSALEGAEFNIVAVFDDRTSVVEMWRSKGFLCLQVANGDF